MQIIFLLTLILYGIQTASAVTHSWKAFYTGSTGMSEFPEFVAVNIVDDDPVGYFDSRTRSFQYRQKWMEEHLGAEYLNQETNILKGYIPSFKANVGIAMERFNQSGGVHTFQYMYGCEWDDESGVTGGFRQYGYDGEDFLIYDVQNQHYVSPTPQGGITVHKWNSDRALLEQDKQYLTHICVEWLKKYVSYGKSSLERKVAPEVSLLQKDPSTPVTCHVTGFFPRQVMVTWQKNGEYLDVDVDLGETVPNEDGTFQTRSHLKVKPEDWKSQKYTCTVEHKSLEQDIILHVTEENIKTNNDLQTPPMGIIIGCVVGALLLAITAIAGVYAWKKRSSGYGKASASDTDSETSSPPAGANAADRSSSQPLVKVISDNPGQ